MIIHQPVRTAFTLVELLVAMALIAILATIAIAFFPNAASAQREARAGQTVQGALQIAKQCALRDGRPCGLRLWIRDPKDRVYEPQTWTAGNSYALLDAVMFNNINYRARVANTASFANQPTGLPTANATWMPQQLVTECEYIEQPNDFGSTTTNDAVFMPQPQPWQAMNYPAPMTGVTLNGVAYYNRIPAPATVIPGANNPQSRNTWVVNASIIAFSTADLTGGSTLTANALLANPPSNNADTNVKYWTVQPGDYLEIKGGGLPRRIQAIFPGNANAAYFVAVTPGLDYALPPTPNYKIMRAPRSMGDDLVKLPENTFIDLDTNAVFPNATMPPTLNASVEGTGHVDILFAPNGSVISKGVSNQNIHLWVRAAAPDQPGGVFRGTPSLISIFVRTGVVGNFEIDPVSTQGVAPFLPTPYTLVR